MALRMKRRHLAVMVVVSAIATAWSWPPVAVVGAQAPGSSQGQTFDWPQHNLDIGGGRNAPLDEVNTSNVDKMVLKWSFKTEPLDIISQITPVVLDGAMYLNAGSTLFALDARTGALRWKYSVEPSFTGSTLGRRGPASDGSHVIYAYGGSGAQAVLYAVDTRTGKAIESFGNRGRLQIADAAVRFKYPQKDPTGYEMAAPPIFYKGMLYLGLAQSEKRITGGIMVAVDGTTGAIKWAFSTVPQGPGDDGWEIAKDTWSGDRIGGGTWTTPVIDPELGMIYINAGNPFPDYAGNTRRGMNLFTNSVIALRMDTGKLVWYHQTIHHDLWDWDLVTGPMLFDVTHGGRTIKGVGAAGKNCLLYLYHRADGKPINPIVETAVPTATDVAGEEPWPTQPFPYTAKGVPMQPFCSTFPIISDPELAKRARQMYTPYATEGPPYIVSHGGSSFGSPSFNARLGLLYVTGKNAAISFLTRSLTKTIIDTTPGGRVDMLQRDDNTGVSPTETVTAYNPATGEVAWQAEHKSRTNIGSAGSLATAGNLVFQGGDVGEFYALDARTGKELFLYRTEKGVRASPLTYRVGGRQYVAVVATDTVLAFGLP